MANARKLTLSVQDLYTKHVSLVRIIKLLTSELKFLRGELRRMNSLPGYPELDLPPSALDEGLSALGHPVGADDYSPGFGCSDANACPFGVGCPSLTNNGDRFGDQPPLPSEGIG